MKALIQSITVLSHLCYMSHYSLSCEGTLAYFWNGQSYVTFWIFTKITIYDIIVKRKLNTGLANFHIHLFKESLECKMRLELLSDKVSSINLHTFTV